MAFETTPCKAAIAFARFVPDHGLVIGDPDAGIDEAKNPAVPVHLVDAWADEGLLEKAGGKKSTKPAADEAPAA